MIEVVHGYWKCDKHDFPVYNPNKTPCRDCAMNGVITTDTTKTAPKRGVGDGSGVNSRKQGKRAFLSYSEYQDLYPASKTEYRRYQYLYGCEQQGIIWWLVLQPKMLISPRVEVKPNGIHQGYTQSARYYSADFAYFYGDHLIIEDAKSGKVDRTRSKRKQIKPFIRSTAARNAHKQLTVKYAQLGLHQYISFILSVEVNHRWYILDSNQNLIDFTLEATEQQKDNAA